MERSRPRHSRSWKDVSASARRRRTTRKGNPLSKIRSRAPSALFHIRGNRVPGVVTNGRSVRETSDFVAGRFRAR